VNPAIVDAADAPGIFEALPACLLIREGSIAFANSAFRRLSEFEDGELLGRKASDLLPVLAISGGVAASGPTVLHTVLLAHDEKKWVDVTADEITVGGLPTTMLVMVDVTPLRQALDRAREREARYRDLFDANPHAMWIYDTESLQFLAVNDAAVESYGYSREELLSMTIRDIRPAEDVPLLEENLARLPRQLERSGVWRHRRRDGSLLQVEVFSHRFQVRGRPARLVLAHDVTDRRHAEEALAAEKERAEVTLAAIHDAIIRIDPQGRIDYMNPAAEGVTGRRAAECCGLPVDEVVAPSAAIWQRCVGEAETVVLPAGSLLRRPDGELREVTGSLTPLGGPGAVAGAVLACRDVSIMRHLERQLRHAITHDALTGLLDRREIERRALTARREADESGAELVLCHLDLDHLKLVNETCGHSAGDALLQQVADVLRRRAPPEAELARLGSDEFALLLSACSVEEARRVARGLIEAVSGLRFHWQGQTFSLGASIGLAPWRDDVLDIAHLFITAETACFIAKQMGRNRYHEYRLEDAAVAERLGQTSWIHRINEAIADGRLRLFEQSIHPLVGSRQRPALAEVLLRMVDEDGRLIGPGSFLPAAERYHLGPLVDHWVVASALDHLGRGGSRGEDRISFLNLSGQSLGDDQFLDFVLASLASHEVAPSSLGFEVTETAAITNLALATRFLHVLRQRGCHFVLDDFGTGLCSFAYLKDLPVEFLKIDGEFVRAMSGDSRQRAIVTSANELGHAFGMQTIAESVESEEAAHTVTAMGIDYAQGYWFSRPQPLEGEAAG
jgi:Amt family ammonium transporter